MESQYVLVDEVEEPKDTGKKAAGAGIVLLVLCGIWGLSDRVAAAIEPSPSCLVMQGNRPESDAGVTRIYGTINNSCQKDFGTVMVFFRLKDAEGKVIGRASATRRDLAPGQSWDFETIGFFNKPDYELEVIKAY